MADEVARRLKELHDQLLIGQPAGGHDAAACAQCTPNQEVPVGGRTYTEEELRAQVDVAVNAAVGDLRTQLDALSASQEAAAIEERIRTAVAEATAPLTAQVTELQNSLDTAVLEAAAATTRAETAETAITAAATAAEVAARSEARLELVKAAAPGFSEEFLAANAERWAAMGDEEFAARIEEYKALSPAAGAPAGGGIPTTSALQATTGDVGAGGRKPATSAVSGLAALRRQGVDVRTI